MFILNVPAEPPVEAPVLMVQSRSNTNGDVVMQDLTPLPSRSPRRTASSSRCSHRTSLLPRPTAHW